MKRVTEKKCWEFSIWRREKNPYINYEHVQTSKHATVKDTKYTHTHTALKPKLDGMIEMSLYYSMICLLFNLCRLSRRPVMKSDKILDRFPTIYECHSFLSLRVNSAQVNGLLLIFRWHRHITYLLLNLKTKWFNLWLPYYNMIHFIYWMPNTMDFNFTQWIEAIYRLNLYLAVVFELLRPVCTR